MDITKLIEWQKEDKYRWFKVSSSDYGTVHVSAGDTSKDYFGLLDNFDNIEEDLREYTRQRKMKQLKELEEELLK